MEKSFITSGLENVFLRYDGNEMLHSLKIDFFTNDLNGDFIS